MCLIHIKHKKTKFVFIAVLKCKENIKLHQQAAEQKIILNDVEYLKHSKSFFISSFSA